MMEGILAAIVVFWVVASVGTTLDAISRDKTALWGVGVFVFGIFGLFAYAIVVAIE